ncbi:hypothetical protein GGX14DRAFT_655051 [Mycena pura]|uniref:Uncharacterized protein n=1 Tax=Mycena pura TaxID=153505 RepID=A0AAD6Y6H2_9AGAR|nr:hypothetical protein GGX14DRAFT_655051 [Mycena pura]
MSSIVKQTRSLFLLPPSTVPCDTLPDTTLCLSSETTPPWTSMPSTFAAWNPTALVPPAPRKCQSGANHGRWYTAPLTALAQPSTAPVPATRAPSARYASCPRTGNAQCPSRLYKCAQSAIFCRIHECPLPPILSAHQFPAARFEQAVRRRHRESIAFPVPRVRARELPHQCLARQQEATARLAAPTPLPPSPTLSQEARDEVPSHSESPWRPRRLGDHSRNLPPGAYAYPGAWAGADTAHMRVRGPVRTRTRTHGAGAGTAPARGRVRGGRHSAYLGRVRMRGRGRALHVRSVGAGTCMGAGTTHTQDGLVPGREHGTARTRAHVGGWERARGPVRRLRGAGSYTGGARGRGHGTAHTRAVQTTSTPPLLAPTSTVPPTARPERRVTTQPKRHTLPRRRRLALRHMPGIAETSPSTAFPIWKAGGGGFTLPRIERGPVDGLVGIHCNIVAIETAGSAPAPFGSEAPLAGVRAAQGEGPSAVALGFRVEPKYVHSTVTVHTKAARRGAHRECRGQSASNGPTPKPAIASLRATRPPTMGRPDEDDLELRG